MHYNGISFTRIYDDDDDGGDDDGDGEYCENQCKSKKTLYWQKTAIIGGTLNFGLGRINAGRLGACDTFGAEDK